jgi:hypothetical protein
MGMDIRILDEKTETKGEMDSWTLEKVQERLGMGARTLGTLERKDI